MLMTLTSTLVLVSYRQERIDARYKENNHVLQPLDSADGGSIEGFALQVIAEEEKSFTQPGIVIKMTENTQKCYFHRSQVSVLVSGSTGLIIRPSWY